MKSKLWPHDEWVMDISLWPSRCFCPHDKETGDIITGMNMIQEECPGKLVGIFSERGQKDVEQWEKENPNWREIIHSKSKH